MRTGCGSAQRTRIQVSRRGTNAQPTRARGLCISADEQPCLYEQRFSADADAHALAHESETE
eukprot:2339184-Pleurochrysis_carterae.AAC.1